MNECVDDSIRFDSFAKTTPTPTSRRVSPASLPRPRSIDVLAPSRVSVSRVVVASSRRRIHPARPAADTDTENHEESRTHTHTGLNAPRLRKTTRCLPREIKTYPYSSISLPYTTHRDPHHTHTHVRTYGNRPSAPTRPRPRTTRSSSDCVVVARSCVRRFDRSIVRVDRDRDGLRAPRSRARVPSRRRHEASSSSRSSRSNERETDGRTERARETSSEGEEEARGWW